MIMVHSGVHKVDSNILLSDRRTHLHNSQKVESFIEVVGSWLDCVKIRSPFGELLDIRRSSLNVICLHNPCI